MVANLVKKKKDFDDLRIYKTKNGGHFRKWIFAEGSFNQKPLALGEIRGAIWTHFVMKLPSKKNDENHDK